MPDTKKLYWIKETYIRPLIQETNDIRVLMREPVLIERVCIALTDREYNQLVENVDGIIPPAMP